MDGVQIYTWVVPNSNEKGTVTAIGEVMKLGFKIYTILLITEFLNP
jgi:hypothetical protein